MLKAMKLAWKTLKKYEEKKKKDQTRLADLAPSWKKFSDYNFTPLNANISEVLMEIKGDPEFWEPPKILGVPMNQNSSKYCKFHEANDHYIEGYLALRQRIEKFIKNGKLVQFLGKQRGTASPKGDYVWEVNYHDRRHTWHPERYRSRSSGWGGQYGNPQKDRGRQEEYKKRRMPLAREERNWHNILEIHTIVGGFAGGGESNQARKAYARQAGGVHEVYVIGRLVKQTRRDLMVIGFSGEDFAGVLQLHTDAMGVTLTIANHNVHRILVDNRSSANILYWSTLKKLDLEQEKIVPTSCPSWDSRGGKYSHSDQSNYLSRRGPFQSKQPSSCAFS